MRLGGRAQAAIEVLRDIEVRRRPASDALRDWGLAHRFAGGGDRSAIGNIVYDALRKKASQAWRMDSETARERRIRHADRAMGLYPGRVAAQFDGDRFAPRRPRPKPWLPLRPAILPKRPITYAPTFRTGWRPSSQRRLRRQLDGAGCALSSRPPLDLRANRLKADRDKVIRQLDRTSAAPGPLGPDAIRIAAGSRDAQAAERASRARLPEGLVRDPGRGQPGRSAACRRGAWPAGAGLLRRRGRQDTGPGGADGKQGAGPRP